MRDICSGSREAGAREIPPIGVRSTKSLRSPAASEGGSSRVGNVAMYGTVSESRSINVTVMLSGVETKAVTREVMMVYFCLT